MKKIFLQALVNPWYGLALEYLFFAGWVSFSFGLFNHPADELATLIAVPVIIAMLLGYVIAYLNQFRKYPTTPMSAKASPKPFRELPLRVRLIATSLIIAVIIWTCALVWGIVLAISVVVFGGLNLYWAIPSAWQLAKILLVIAFVPSFFFGFLLLVAKWYNAKHTMERKIDFDLAEARAAAERIVDGHLPFMSA